MREKRERERRREACRPVFFFQAAISHKKFNTKNFPISTTFDYIQAGKSQAGWKEPYLSQQREEILGKIK